MNREETIDALLLLLDSSSDSSSEDFNSTTSSSSSWSSMEDDETGRDSSFLTKIKNYTDEEFMQKFHMTRKSAELVLEKFKNAGIASKKQRGGQDLIGAETQIYIFLWYVTNCESFSQVGHLFDVARTSVWEIVNRVSSWISNISKEFSSWPVGADLLVNTQKFAAMCNIPGVVGVIDVMHIQIKAPNDNKLANCKRQQNISLAVQIVVDANIKFIDLHYAEPGSRDKSQILMRSDLFCEATQNIDNAFPSNTFLLGGSAYPCLKWLITPFNDNGCPAELQQSFNKLHGVTRTIVEKAFGNFKTKFKGIQKFEDPIDLRLCKNIILAACVLHNICIDNNESGVDNFESENLVDEEGNDSAKFASFLIEEGHERRDNLLQSLVESGKLWRSDVQS